ncbi:hypothetical protein AMAG_19674 [Allomyces macrogynus ATCC 38327]|uniref:Uncharacterized protein n=1 Tax=Allomyces macrogynus (strain ATCC 38327) TaxID=578462 RepID=A0A0L0SXG8_ALLM3|nr:hypothetical protein AMAG_19674 [Allomyces macrogynus ATCC 38327]|eukprot:KNE67258.1 hypothetical protein AMAG_19674 [Allomyces macrogynus ATCC 38327]
MKLPTDMHKLDLDGDVLGPNMVVALLERMPAQRLSWRRMKFAAYMPISRAASGAVQCLMDDENVRDWWWFVMDILKQDSGKDRSKEESCLVFPHLLIASESLSELK